MKFPILFGTTVTRVLHYRADCDVLPSHWLHAEFSVLLTDVLVLNCSS